jgi:hypothetical protein
LSWRSPLPIFTDLSGAGDAQQGLIKGSEVLTATTNVRGAVLTTFTKVEGATGEVGVPAELLMQDNGALRSVHEDRKMIQLGTAPPPPTAQSIYLTLIQK